MRDHHRNYGFPPHPHCARWTLPQIAAAFMLAVAIIVIGLITVGQGG